MKRALALLAPFTAAVIVVAFQAVAADRPANYFVLKGGIYSPSKDFNINNINIDSKTGFNGEVAFGHYILPVFATELGVGYFESKGDLPAQSGETKLKVVPVTLTAKGLLPFGPVEPYGEFGIGGYITELDVSGNLGAFSGSTKGAFGLHAGGGVNFNISPAVFLGVEGRYLWAKPSFGGQDIKLDGFTVTGDLGFRF